MKKKNETLKKAYYRSFFLLIVLPLGIVFIVAAIVIGYIIQNSSIKTIDVFQENAVDALFDDIRTASLQLSHFVYVNDGEFLEFALQVNNLTGDEQYAADQQLQKAFRTAMVPSQDILAGAFYMKNGGNVYMKDDVIIPGTQIRAEEWYCSAKSKPNQVIPWGYDIHRDKVVRSGERAGQFVIVTAMAVDKLSDRSGEIDVVCLFTVSQIGDIFLRARSDVGLGTSVILDREGNVIFGDGGNEAIRSFFSKYPGEFVEQNQTRRANFEGEEQTYFFHSKAIPDTEWTMVTFVEEYRLGKQIYQVGSCIALVIIALITFFYVYSYYFLNAIITPVHVVCEGIKRLDNGDLYVQVEPRGEKEIKDLMISFNQMVQSIKNMISFTEETAKKKHEAEIQALQSQINPHFIVNSLNSIRFMAQIAQFDGIRKMAEALVKIVSCSFRSNVSFYTVREELEMLKTYEYLMRIRYSNGFEVNYGVEPECLDYRLPRLILQPVLENSITHGFDEMDEEVGQIRISVYTTEQYLCLSVWDNGRGMSQKQIHQLLRGRIRRNDDNSSIGLENVIARLRLNFGSDVVISVDSVLKEYTNIVFKLPLETCKKLKAEEEKYGSCFDCR